MRDISPNLSRSMPSPMLTAMWFALQDFAAVRLVVPRSSVRVVVHILGQIVGDHGPFLVDIVFDGAPEGGVTDLVRAVGNDRQEAPGQLVFSLRPRLEERETALDGKLYSLVVA